MDEKEYILIAEDSPTQAEQLKYILEAHEYTVHHALNGQLALDMVRRRKPLMIISDVVMPEMDGYKFCEAIKNDPALREIPFVLLTSLSDPKDVIKGLQSGADNFLTKPYNDKFLMSRVQYILANYELRKNLISGMGIEIVFAGHKYFINSDRIQIIDLLLSTYENAIQKNGELAQANHNLTEMHRELERKNVELEKANVEKNKFLGMAAHDIRNPISLVLSSSAFLEEELMDIMTDDQRELLSMIKSSSEFVLGLLNELLDISVIESGSLRLNFYKTDLGKLIDRNLSLNRVTANKKGITLGFSSDAGIPLVTLDATKIEQVMNNLISNAIKFSFENSHVQVDLLNQGDQVCVRVRDEGQGIPEKEIGMLFKPFQKTSVRATSGERSTGLGLSIVNKIVEAHRGRVWVESHEGKGSTFFVLLPVEQPGQPAGI